MKTTINTLTADSNNVIHVVKVTVEVQAGMGIHITNIADDLCKCMILRAFTTLQTAGYRLPAKKIVISFSENLTHMTSLPDAAVIMATLIADRQVIPTLDCSRMCIAGEAVLEKGIVRYPEAAKKEDVRYDTPDWLMYVVPDELQKEMEEKTDCYALAADDIRSMAELLETQNPDVHEKHQDRK